MTSISPLPFDDPDAAALRAELESELLERYGEDTEPGTKPHAGDVAVFLVARGARGEALGCGALRELEPGTVELKRMYVRPAARGTGLGRRLLAALEREAAALGARRIVLETGDAQPEAIGLYERAGYRRTARFGDDAEHPRSRYFERVLG